MTDRRTALTIAEAVEPFTEQTEHSLLVVTTADENELAGCLVGFATQCSIYPPRFMVCISKVNHTYFTVERSGAVAMHLLREEQTGLASLFGEGTGDTVSKFSRLSWHRGLTGAPVLDDCAAWIEGRVIRRFGAGDHEALVVQPLDGGGGTGSRVLTLQHSPEFRPGHPVSG